MRYNPRYRTETAATDTELVRLTWPNPTPGEFEGQYGVEGAELVYKWTALAEDVYAWVPLAVIDLGTPVARLGPLLGTEDSTTDWETAGADTTALNQGAGSNGLAELSAADGYARVRVRASNTGNGSNYSAYNNDALTSTTLLWASVELDITTFSGPNSAIYAMFAAQSDNSKSWRLGRQQNVAYLEAISQTTGEEALPTDGAMPTGTRYHIATVVDSSRARAWLNGRLVLSVARANFPAASGPLLGVYVGTGTSSGNEANVGYGAGSVWGVITPA